jgi:hypothetical protein
MAPEESIDQMVDKAIEEALIRSNKENDDIKKRRPKPFRYLRNPKEIQAELSSEEPSVSIMEKSPAAKIYDKKVAILGLGDVDTIENVIKRHQASRKFIKNK